MHDLGTLAVYLHVTVIIHLPIERSEVAGGAKSSQPLSQYTHGRLRKIKLVRICQLNNVTMIIVRKFDGETMN